MLAIPEDPKTTITLRQLLLMREGKQLPTVTVSSCDPDDNTELAPCTVRVLNMTTKLILPKAVESLSGWNKATWIVRDQVFVKVTLSGILISDTYYTAGLCGVHRDDTFDFTMYVSSAQPNIALTKVLTDGPFVSVRRAADIDQNILRNQISDLLSYMNGLLDDNQ